MSDNSEPDIRQLFDLSGRVALVTGADGYLGFHMACALAEAGCRVVVSGIDLKTARRTAGKLGGAQRGRHLFVAINHMSEASIRRGFTSAVTQAKNIDVLVNNAHEPLAADWRSVTGSQFNRQLGNATGYFLLARLLRDHAVKRRAGASIILLGSMYGMVASYPEVYEGVSPASPAAYQAAKGGIIQLARHLAVYWAKDGVRVNCLSPGPFPGPRVSPKLVNRLKRRSPMKRMGQPHELKGAVVFLASNASSYVSGHNLIVDGAWTAW